MSTYLAMQTRIADELARDNISQQIKNAIQTTIKHFERDRFWFNTKIITFETVVNQEYYDSTAHADIPNIIDFDAATYDIDGSKQPMEQVPFMLVDAAQSSDVVGEPYYYAYYDERIRLYPIPNQAARTITMAVHHRLAMLSADTDTNAWMVEAEELIRLMAKADLLENVIRDESGFVEAARLRQRAIGSPRGGVPSVYYGLKAETNTREHDGKLRLDGIPVNQRSTFNINDGEYAH